MAQLFFKRPLQQAIREGRKHTTIRRWDKPRLAAGQQAYSPGLGWLAIISVEPIDLDHLDDSHAQADGFETKILLVEALRSLYPQSDSDGKRWFLVRFSIHKLQARRARADAENQPKLF